ncbi:MAG: hypothetical protein AAFU64_01005 [Bacteroidota bacterium]
MKAVYGGDMETAHRLLSEQIKLSIGGNNALSGHKEGRDVFF